MAHVGHELVLVLARDLEVFDSFGKLARARLHLLKQSRVLDSDDGLVSEGPYKLDLAVGEGVHGAPRERKGANRHSFAQERHGNNGVKSADLGASQLVVRLGLGVDNMNRNSLKQRTSGCTSTSRLDGSPFQVFLQGGRDAIGR